MSQQEFRGQWGKAPRAAETPRTEARSCARACRPGGVSSQQQPGTQASPSTGQTDQHPHEHSLDSSAFPARPCFLADGYHPQASPPWVQSYLPPLPVGGRGHLCVTPQGGCAGPEHSPCMRSTVRSASRLKVLANVPTWEAPQTTGAAPGPSPSRRRCTSSPHCHPGYVTLTVKRELTLGHTRT